MYSVERLLYLAYAPEGTIGVDKPQRLKRAIHGLLLGCHIKHHRGRQVAHQSEKEPRRGGLGEG